MSSENQSSNWQDVTPGLTNRRSDPKLTVRASGDGYLNKAADQRWFEDVDQVRLQIDRDRLLLRLIPESTESDQTFKVARESDYGGEISLKSALRRLGTGRPDETMHAPVESSGDAIVADLSSVFETGATDSTVEAAVDEVNEPAEAVADALDDDVDDEDVDEDSESQADDPHPRDVVAEWARRTVANGDAFLLESREIAEELDDVSSRQVGQYLGQLKDADGPVAVEHVDDQEWDRSRWRLEPADGRRDESGSDAGDDPELEAVVSAVQEDGVESVTELGEALELRPDRARTSAMKAGVYTELDDAPEEGGYGRPGGE